MKYNNIVPPFVGSNLTQNGFTVSSDSGSAYRGVDGLFSEGKYSYRSGVGSTLPEYFTIRFPKTYKLARYKLTLGFAYEAQSRYTNMATWDLEGLVDGSWVKLHSGSNADSPKTLTFDITPVDVKGVRIKCNSRHGTNTWGFDEITLYEVEYSENILIYNEGVHKKYNGSDWVIVTTATPTDNDFITNSNTISEINSFTELVWLKLTGNIDICYFTDNSYTENSYAIIGTDTFSVYDYISENPQVVIYTESTDDITVSTTTEPYELYDEFGNELEVLYYTDDEAVAEVDLTLEANWSPIDELEGDLEVVTWTDEPQESAQRVLEMTAIPKPQFVKLVNPKRLYGYLDDIVAVDASTSYRDEVRYLFTDNSNTKWYVWDKALKQFKEVDASTHELILKNGMKYNDIDALTESDWRTWDKEYMNIGIFLKDNPRDTITSVVDSVSYKDYLPRNTTTIEKTSLYILNTTAKIDIELNGSILKGILSDDDLTRVQYRVSLNGEAYYPTNGEFTKLGEGTQNIELVVGSKDIKIDDWNTIKVEFQDFFGTTDYWSTQFIGTYSGLMFKDVYGQYYSSEIGEILQYLDFGVIIAGQTTLEHEVVLKNQYGYDVNNIHLYANASSLPSGMKIEFSPTQTPFSPQSDLRLSKTLANNEEMSFFIRLKTELGTTPSANGSFDIIVKADRVYN